MSGYILRRLLWAPFVLLVVSFVTFFLGLYGPGDPVDVRLGQRYEPELAERLRHELGLDRPLAQRDLSLRNDTGAVPGLCAHAQAPPRRWLGWHLRCPHHPAGGDARSCWHRWRDPHDARLLVGGGRAGLRAHRASQGPAGAAPHWEAP